MSVNKIALIIGIDEYSRAEELPSLPSCKKDAEDMAQLLRKIGFTIFGDKPIIGSDLDKDGWTTIHRAIRDFFNRAKPSHTLLFYFSGHGITREDEIYLATPQVEPQDPIVEGYALSNLAKLMKSSKSKRIVSVIDACHSGAAQLPESGTRPKSRALLEAEEAGIALATYDRMLDDEPKGEGRYFLLSSQGYQSSFALADDNSLYTKYLIEGLSGAGPTSDINGDEIPGSTRDDGVITPETLHEYVYFKVASRMDQIPKLKGDKSSSIVLAHYPELARRFVGEPGRDKDSEKWTASKKGYKDFIAKGDLLLYEGRSSEAVAQYDKAIDFAPNLFSAWFKKGTALAGLGKTQEAIACWDKIIEIDPKQAGAWYQKGVTLSTKGKYKEAIECYEKAMQITPNDSRPWFQKGNLLTAMGEKQKAIACYDKVVEIEPDNVNAWYQKGIGLELMAIGFDMMGKKKEAIACYDKVLEIEPEHVAAWNQKAAALSSLAEGHRAVECWDRSIEIDPTQFRAWYEKGSYLFTAFKYRDAIKCFDKSIEIEPKNSAPWVMKAHAFEFLGEKEKASECNARATELQYSRG